MKTQRQFHEVFKWCEDHSIKIYPVTELETELARINYELATEIITKQQHDQKHKELFNRLVPSSNPKLRIAIEENGVATFGTMQFINNKTADGIQLHDQIRLLYQLKYEKEIKKE